MTNMISRQEAKSLDLLHYYTGNPCKHGHVSERVVSTGQCCACATAWSQTPERKAQMAARQRIPEVKVRKAALEQAKERKAKRAAYNQTPERKAKKASYDQTVAAKARKATYEKTPEAKAKQVARRQKPESKAKRAATSAIYRAVNKERTAASFATWAAANPHVMNAKNAQRRAAKLERTPKWLTTADKAAIKSIYEQCAFTSRVTGQAHHVDHILPLQGETVSGLHVPINLQILTATENVKKSNKLLDDQFSQ